MAGVAMPGVALCFDNDVPLANVPLGFVAIVRSRQRSTAFQNGALESRVLQYKKILGGRV